MIDRTTRQQVPAMSDETFRRVRDYLYEQSGIHFAENRKYFLEDRLRDRLRDLRLADFDEYLYYLRFDVSRTDEIIRLMDTITTGETYFYRDNRQIEALEKAVIPEILRRTSTKRQIGIWSAGCSSGEEPYTVAILLHELLSHERPLWNVRIYANDISQEAIRKAREAHYAEYAMRAVPPSIAAKYFRRNEKAMMLDESVRRMVEFHHVSLTDTGRLRFMRDIQLILCRNVLVYFNELSRKKVVDHFYDTLDENGYLMLGFSESIHNISRSFGVMHYPGAVYYRKE